LTSDKDRSGTSHVDKEENLRGDKIASLKIVLQRRGVISRDEKRKKFITCIKIMEEYLKEKRREKKPSCVAVVEVCRPF